jgi:type III restriction enzyme
MARTTKKIDLSEHTLDINPRKYSVDKLDITEIEDYVRDLAGSRDYEYEAIINILKYLWGGSYESVVKLAEENWETKEAIQQRFQSKEHFINTMPLPDKLSGVCHMATGTGKSYVIFAIAYLSILLEKVNRVLILTPSSTIIKKGLREKIHEHMFGERGLELKQKLPARYRNKTVKLITRNDAPEDNAIMVENINGIFQYFHDRDHNSIAGFFNQTDEVLVLSDEVHHAYSRWDPSKVSYDFDELNREGRQTEAENERRWMKFIREAEKEKIKRHIGFTGTPYNKDDFFTDVIFNYTIKRAIDEKYIKDIDAILETDEEINKNQRFEQIIQTHYQNKEKYSYLKNGKPHVKPITVFICSTQKSAQRNEVEFAKVLADYLKNNFPDYKSLPRSVLEAEASEKVICVVSETANKVADKFENIEELNPAKPGGKVEYVFSVQMLTEGWDVDNLFQIVPMEERAFASKLLISQVLGRGLRIPRKIGAVEVAQNYPILTVTNHEKFSQQVQELLDAVTQCELRLVSSVFQKKDFSRYKHHFNLFNIKYIPQNKKVLKEQSEIQQAMPDKLQLDEQEDKLDLRVKFIKGEKRFLLSKESSTFDEVVAEIVKRFKLHVFEREHFDFGDGVHLDHLPKREDIEEVIKKAMKRAKITGNKISKENRKKIEIFFNQFLPQGKKKVVRENIEGNLYGKSTEVIPQSSASAGGLDNFISVFVSENYKEELTQENLTVIGEIQSGSNRMGEGSQQLALGDETDFNEEYIRRLISGKNIYTVNSSMFKTSQDLVIVTHKPERQFVYSLIENSRHIDSWVKSPDKGFYSLEYTYWKRGKDRTIRNFNPDFFIKVNLDDYLIKLNGKGGKLRELQDKGIEELILVVEIKGDEEMKENVAAAKAESGKEHFNKLTKRLQGENPNNFKEEFRNSTNQYYKFFLLKPFKFQFWFQRLREGRILE